MCARVRAGPPTTPPAIAEPATALSRIGPPAPRPAVPHSGRWRGESRTSETRRLQGASPFAGFSASRSLVAPEALQMPHTSFQIRHLHARAKFENFDVFRFHHRSEGRKINHARTRRTMVATRKLHIVKVKARQPVRQ